MKHILLLLFTLSLGTAIASAQSTPRPVPIKWNCVVQPIADHPNEYKLLVEGYLEPGWYVYSQTVPEGGLHPHHHYVRAKRNSYRGHQFHRRNWQTYRRMGCQL